MDAYKPQATQSMRWLTENRYFLPRTLTAETPSGGVHHYYQANSPALRNSNGRPRPGAHDRVSRRNSFLDYSELTG